MSGEQTPWVSVVDALIPQPGTGRVLVLEAGEGLRLPPVPIDNIWAGDVGAVCQVVRRELGLATVLLRPAAVRPYPERRRLEITYALESRDPAWLPPEGMRWADRADLGAVAAPEQRELLAAHFDELETGPPPGRAPWELHGWLDEAAAWIERSLAERGETIAGPVEQVKSWGISCVLRARASGGDVYFKVAAALPLFVNEPLVLQRLAPRYPAHIPAPLALDAGRRWVLLRDFGTPLRQAGPTPEAREQMLAAFAAIQRDAAARVPELLAAGLHDRRLATLPAYAAALAEDEAALAGLEPDERARLRALQPRLASMCAELAALGIPETLVHGDLHLGNVALQGGALVFFDWTDACVAHPFFDLISVYGSEDQELLARMRDAYLGPWAGVAPPEQIAAAWDLARPLCDLHQAVSYRHIIAGLEPAMHADFQGEMLEFLRSMLTALQP